MCINIEFQCLGRRKSYDTFISCLLWFLFRLECLTETWKYADFFGRSCAWYSFTHRDLRWMLKNTEKKQQENRERDTKKKIINRIECHSSEQAKLDFCFAFEHEKLVHPHTSLKFINTPKYRPSAKCTFLCVKQPANTSSNNNQRQQHFSRLRVPSHKRIHLQSFEISSYPEGR